MQLLFQTCELLETSCVGVFLPLICNLLLRESNEGKKILSAGKEALRIPAWTKTPLSAKSLLKPHLHSKLAGKLNCWSGKGKFGWEEGSEWIRSLDAVNSVKAQEGSAVLNISAPTVKSYRLAPKQDPKGNFCNTIGNKKDIFF